jgi:hypothetical protein
VYTFGTTDLTMQINFDTIGTRMRRLVRQILCALACMLFTGYINFASSAATLVTIQGDVRVKQAERQEFAQDEFFETTGQELELDESFWPNAIENQSLEKDDIIQTGGKSSCEILFDDGSVICLEENSRLTIIDPSSSSSHRQIQIALKIGRLLVDVEKKQVSGDFTIRTPAVVSAVRGTQFIIEVGEDDTTSIGLFDGELEVNRIQPEEGTFEAELESIRLVPGQEFNVGPGWRKPKRTKMTRQMLKHRKQLQNLDKRAKYLRRNIKKIQKQRAKSKKQLIRQRKKHQREFERQRSK